MTNSEVFLIELGGFNPLENGRTHSLHGGYKSGGDPNLVTGIKLQVVGHLKHRLVKFDHFPRGEK